MDGLGDAFGDAERAVPGLAVVCVLAVLGFFIAIVALRANMPPQPPVDRSRFVGCYTAVDQPPMLITREAVELVGETESVAWEPLDTKSGTAVSLPFELVWQEQRWRLVRSSRMTYASVYNVIGIRRFDRIPVHHQVYEISFLESNGQMFKEVIFRRDMSSACERT